MLAALGRRLRSSVEPGACLARGQRPARPRARCATQPVRLRAPGCRVAVRAGALTSAVPLPCPWADSAHPLRPYPQPTVAQERNRLGSTARAMTPSCTARRPARRCPRNCSQPRRRRIRPQASRRSRRSRLAGPAMTSQARRGRAARWAEASSQGVRGTRSSWRCGCAARPLRVRERGSEPARWRPQLGHRRALRRGGGGATPSHRSSVSPTPPPGRNVARFSAAVWPGRRRGRATPRTGDRRGVRPSVRANPARACAEAKGAQLRPPRAEPLHRARPPGKRAFTSPTRRGPLAVRGGARGRAAVQARGERLFRRHPVAAQGWRRLAAQRTGYPQSGPRFRWTTAPGRAWPSGHPCALRRRVPGATGRGSAEHGQGSAAPGAGTGSARKRPEDSEPSRSRWLPQGAAVRGNGPSVGGLRPSTSGRAPSCPPKSSPVGRRRIQGNHGRSRLAAGCRPALDNRAAPGRARALHGSGAHWPNPARAARARNRRPPHGRAASTAPHGGIRPLRA